MYVAEDVSGGTRVEKRGRALLRNEREFELAALKTNALPPEVLPFPEQRPLGAQNAEGGVCHTPCILLRTSAAETGRRGRQIGAKRL